MTTKQLDILAHEAAFETPKPDKSLKTKDVIAEVQAAYLADNRPWVIGYSGGKDSTCTLQLVWMALNDLPRKDLKKMFMF